MVIVVIRRVILFMFCAVTVSLVGADDLRLIIPIAGVENVDWTLAQHVDHDPTAGVRDYMGGPYTYDGHRGTDFNVPNFRWMDLGHPILAAAAGRVVDVTDGAYDRNAPTELPSGDCGGGGNRVKVEHPNGWRTLLFTQDRADPVM